MQKEFLQEAEYSAHVLTGIALNNIVAGFKNDVCLISLLDGTIIGHSYQDKNDKWTQWTHVSHKFI